NTEPVEPRERTRRKPPAEPVLVYIRSNGNSVHSLNPSRHRTLERQDWHLAFSCVGSDALWRAFLCLHFFAHRCSPWDVATRPAQCSGRHDEYRDFDLVVRHSRARVGGAKDEKISRLLVVHACHYYVRCDFLDGQTCL